MCEATVTEEAVYVLNNLYIAKCFLHDQKQFPLMGEVYQEGTISIGSPLHPFLAPVLRIE